MWLILLGRVVHNPKITAFYYHHIKKLIHLGKWLIFGQNEQGEV